MLTKDGFAHAYQKGFHSTVRFLLSRGVPSHEADETAQHAWVRAWERRGQLRNPAKILAWVNRIGLNLFRNKLRATREYTCEIPEVGSVPDSGRYVDLGRGLQQCSPLERRLLYARFAEGLSSEELAERFSCTPGAARVRVMRAKDKLASKVDLPGPLTPPLVGLRRRPRFVTA